MNITPEIRLAIRVELLKPAYDGKLFALAERRQTLAYSVYDDITAELDLYSIPIEWLARNKTQFLTTTDGSRVYGFNTTGCMPPMDRAIRSNIALNDRSKFWWREPKSGKPIILPRGSTASLAHKLTEVQYAEYHEIKITTQDTLHEMIKTAAQIETRMSNTRSPAKLVKDWPEIEPVVDQMCGSSNPVAVETSALNAVLGIGG